jgi:hypothetical protein
MHRRTALQVSGGALALVLAGGAGWLVRRDGSDDSPVPRPAFDTLPAAVGDAPVFADVDPGVIAVGTRYVQTHPDDADLTALLDSFPEVDGDPLDAAATLSREEFRRGDTVVVDGWVLARSEARAAAVIALSCAGDRC